MVREGDMSNSLLWGATLLLAAPPTDHVSAAAPANVGPSFQCDRPLSAAEKLVCGDSELSAYDRAVTFAYTHKWHSTGSWHDQRQWLKKRDDCGRERICLLAVYKEWIGGLESATAPGPLLHRRGSVPSDGSDLMLGTLQSRTGRVKPLGDEGDLYIRPLGGEWYFFQAKAEHFYDPHDGRGANATTSQATGLVHLRNGAGAFDDDPTTQESCKVRLTRLANGAWRLVENGDSCSGLGSTLTGVYRK
jgi:hypothetical protein